MKFPVLISIPHCGQSVPEELKDHNTLNPIDILADSDAFTDAIYDIGKEGFPVIKTAIARAFVDLNRAPDDLPPDNPDGVVKSHTCYNVPVYSEDFIPKGDLLKNVLSKYYQPYHNKIKEICKLGDILLALDCHSMASISPPVAPDSNKKRPLICLGNIQGQSCNEEVTKKLAESLSFGFSVPVADITVNEPFGAGTLPGSMETILFLGFKLN